MRSKSKRSKLVRKLDKLHRQLLFKKFGEQCVQCGSRHRVTVGHVFSRRKYSTRWDLHDGGNVYPQCWSDNYKHVRDQYPYFNWFIKKYGQKKFDELRKRYETIKKVSTKELEELVEKFEKMLQSNSSVTE